MKNILSPIAFTALGLLAVFSMPQAAFSQIPAIQTPVPCVITSPGTSFGCASDSAVNGVSSAVGAMNQAITNSIGILAKEITANEAISDAQKTNTTVQNQAITAGMQNGAAVLAAIQKYKPSYEDCASMTSRMVSSAIGASFRTDAAMLALSDPKQGTSDAAILIKGPPGGAEAYRQAYATKAQTAMNEVAKGTPSYTDAGTFNPDMSQVKMFCQSDKCFNASLFNMVNGMMIMSTGDKPPTAAANNPQIGNYFLQRAAWGADRSEARETIFKLLPKMYKSRAYYTQALASFGNNPDAVTILNQEYPNSAKIGLSEYELQEAEFAALTSAQETLVKVGQGDAERQRAAATLQANAAQLQIAKMERDAFDGALRAIKNTPPSVSASAISTTH